MASGDTVFEADNMTVFKHVEGKNAGLPEITSTLGNGYRVSMGVGLSPTGEMVIRDLIVMGATPSASPFDPTKTYDVIIKEH
jgi:hypothetical protein